MQMQKVIRECLNLKDKFLFTLLMKRELTIE